MAVVPSHAAWALLAWMSSASTPTLAQQQDAGKAVFARVCESCHGPAGAGGQGPALVPFEKELPELVAIVRQGIGLMPSIPRAEISDAEIEQVHAYLKRLTTADASGRQLSCCGVCTTADSAGQMIDDAQRTDSGTRRLLRFC
jgi:mono/diheme cytochrome c family protein